jgi:hypothetical protein
MRRAPHAALQHRLSLERDYRAAIGVAGTPRSNIEIPSSGIIER